MSFLTQMLGMADPAAAKYAKRIVHLDKGTLVSEAAH